MRAWVASAAVATVVTTSCAQRAAPAPSAREVAEELARSPSFARAVAEELARRSAPGREVLVLPRAGGAGGAGDAGGGATQGDVIAIAVGSDGSASVDGQRVSDPELTTVLRTRVAAAPSLRAVIRADPAAPRARVEQLRARVRAAGVGSVVEEER